MDPQATLYDLLDAIDRNDRMDVDELLMALWDWNAKGGFQPQVRRVSNRDSMFAVSRSPLISNLQVDAKVRSMTPEEREELRNGQA
jgi:hypothetical protein